MKKEILIPAVVLVLIVFIIYVFSRAEDTRMEQEGSMENNAMMEGGDKMEGEAMMEADTKMEADEAMMMDDGDHMDMSKGTYEAYTPEKLTWAEGEGKVVLFFKASWCPTCRALDADLKSNMSSIPAGVTILEVDYDNSAELKKKYGVTTQHTLVQVAANGELVTKWSGGNTLGTVLTKIN